MKRAVIYSRFSSDLQSDRSIDDQLALCREISKRDGMKIVAEYEDRARSGASMHGRTGISKILEAATAKMFDVLIVESLDRISRDQADTASIFKTLNFHGVRILTAHDGYVDHFQVGIRGIISSAYLVDLAQKTHRGLAGNIRVGKHAGGLAYGYRTTLGKPGHWVVEPAEAEIIRRIFAQYLSGMRPREIIEQLNRDGVTPPRGRYWQPGALTGSNNRHNGILGNEIYCGRLVWNRVQMMKNPETGKRVSRPNPETEWHRTDVPRLQIISSKIFDEVISLRRERSHLAPAFRRKPKRLLSGLLRCAVCGGGMSIKGEDRGGTRVICTQFHNAKTCDNNRTYYLDHVEQMVLSGLKKHLVDPTAIRLFLQTYHAERKRLIASANRVRPDLERKLAGINRKIERLTDAMIDSDAPVSQFTRRISKLNEEKERFEGRLQDLSTPSTTVSLHPAAQERYLAVVENLAGAMKEMSQWVEMVEAVRELIESVVVERTKPGEPLRLKVNGRLAALIGRPMFPESSLSGAKVVAGERYRLSPHDPNPRYLLRSSA
jgi:site-specific DNA recombinase